MASREDNTADCKDERDEESAAGPVTSPEGAIGLLCWALLPVLCCCKASLSLAWDAASLSGGRGTESVPAVPV